MRLGRARVAAQPLFQNKQEDITMNNSRALKRHDTIEASDSLQTISHKLSTCRQDPGRIERIDTDNSGAMGLFPASQAIVAAMAVGGQRLYLSRSLLSSDITQILRQHSGPEFTDRLHQADLVLCNEIDCPDLDALEETGASICPTQKTLIIQCQSFFRGITYQTAGPTVRHSRKLRCSAFNGPLVHQRRKLRHQHPAIDLILVNGSEFVCVPAGIQLLAAAR